MINNELKELIINNPELPMYALVDSEVVPSDEYCSWYGKFGRAEIREYANIEPYGWNDYCLVFKDDTEDYMEYLLGDDEWDSSTLSDEEIELEVKKRINNLNYKKAIFVNVGCW